MNPYCFAETEVCVNMVFYLRMFEGESKEDAELRALVLLDSLSKNEECSFQNFKTEVRDA